MRTTTTATFAQLPDRMPGARRAPELLRDAVELAWTRPWLLVVVPALCGLTTDVLGRFLVAGTGEGTSARWWTEAVVAPGLTSVVDGLLAAVALCALREMAAGRRGDLRTALRHSVPLMPRVVAVYLLWVPLMTWIGSDVPVEMRFPIFLGGLYLVFRWSFAAPACVFEGVGGFHALGRSHVVMSALGSWRVGGLFLLLLLLAGGLSSSLHLGVGAVLPLDGHWGESLPWLPLGALAQVVGLVCVLLYLDGVDARAVRPLGNDLVDPAGNRRPPPQSDGVALWVFVVLASVASAAVAVHHAQTNRKHVDAVPTLTDQPHSAR